MNSGGWVNSKSAKADQIYAGLDNVDAGTARKYIRIRLVPLQWGTAV